MNNKTVNKFYVYFHIKPNTNEVFYVGKGNGNRAFSLKNRSNFWKQTVKKHGLKIEFINTKLSEKRAFELEKIYIKKFGRRDLGNGSLVNMTDGGDGRSGLICSEETRLKISKVGIGRTNKNKGGTISEETKQKISQSNLGNKSALGYKHTKITKDKISKATKGENNPFFNKTHNEETKRKIIESNQKRKGEKRKKYERKK